MRDTFSAEDRVFERVIWRVMPLVAFVYFVSIVDKSNVGFAKLQMLEDLGMSEAAYGFASSLFFIGLVAFELPGSLLAQRFGVRFCTMRFMVTWGAITLSMMLVTTPAMFQLLRFVLGVMEAGLYPALLFYIACWFPQRFRARAAGFLTLGSAFGNGLGAALSGPTLDLDGMLGLAGWQWLFLVTGLLPLVTAAAIWRLMPENIEEASFLTPSEKQLARAAVDRDTAHVEASGRHFLAMFWDTKVLVLSLVFMVILMALHGTIYWLPTVVRGFNLSGTGTGLLTALPWMVVAAALFTIPPRLKQPRQTILASAVIALVGAALFMLSTIVSTNWARLLCLVFATPCISLLIACFWTLPVRYFSGIHAAAALGVITTISNFGGFIAQNLMPWAAKVTGSAVGAMYVPAAALAIICCAALLLLAWGHQMRATAVLVEAHAAR